MQGSHQNAWNDGVYRYAPAFTTNIEPNIAQAVYTRTVAYQQANYGRDHVNASSASHGHAHHGHGSPSRASSASGSTLHLKEPPSMRTSHGDCGLSGTNGVRQWDSRTDDASALNEILPPARRHYFSADSQGPMVFALSHNIFLKERVLPADVAGPLALAATPSAVAAEADNYLALASDCSGRPSVSSAPRSQWDSSFSVSAGGLNHILPPARRAYFTAPGAADAAPAPPHPHRHRRDSIPGGERHSVLLALAASAAAAADRAGGSAAASAAAGSASASTSPAAAAALAAALPPPAVAARLSDAQLKRVLTRAHYAAVAAEAEARRVRIDPTQAHTAPAPAHAHAYAHMHAHGGRCPQRLPRQPSERRVGTAPARAGSRVRSMSAAAPADTGSFASAAAAASAASVAAAAGTTVAPGPLSASLRAPAPTGSRAHAREAGWDGRAQSGTAPLTSPATGSGGGRGGLSREAALEARRTKRVLALVASDAPASTGAGGAGAGVGAGAGGAGALSNAAPELLTVGRVTSPGAARALREALANVEVDAGVGAGGSGAAGFGLPVGMPPALAQGGAQGGAWHELARLAGREAGWAPPADTLGSQLNESLPPGRRALFGDPRRGQGAFSHLQEIEAGWGENGRVAGGVNGGPGVAVGTQKKDEFNVLRHLDLANRGYRFGRDAAQGPTCALAHSAGSDAAGAGGTGAGEREPATAHDRSLQRQWTRRRERARADAQAAAGLSPQRRAGTARAGLSRSQNVDALRTDKRLERRRGGWCAHHADRVSAVDWGMYRTQRDLFAAPREFGRVDHYARPHTAGPGRWRDLDRVEDEEAVMEDVWHSYGTALADSQVQRTFAASTASAPAAAHVPR